MQTINLQPSSPLPVQWRVDEPRTKVRRVVPHTRRDPHRLSKPAQAHPPRNQPSFHWSTPPALPRPSARAPRAPHQRQNSVVTINSCSGLDFRCGPHHQWWRQQRPQRAVHRLRCEGWPDEAGVSAAGAAAESVRCWRNQSQRRRLLHGSVPPHPRPHVHAPTEHTVQCPAHSVQTQRGWNCRAAGYPAWQ